MMDQIKLVVFIVLAVMALIIVIALFRKGSKDRILTKIEQLKVSFNELRTIPLSVKFKSAQAIAKRNEETDQEIKEYYSRYIATQSIIDEVDNIFINVENFKADHSYGKIKELIPTLEEKVLTCQKEVQETEEFLKRYEAKSTEQRSFATSLKQEFQMVRDTIRNNMNQLSVSYDAISARLEACSALFTKSEDAMYGSDYVTAQNALEQIQKELHDIKLVVNEIPPITKDVTVAIPTLIEEVESSSSYIKQKGIYIEHLQVRETLDKVSGELRGCIEKASNLEIEGLTDRILNLKNELNSLNSSLQAEDNKYVSAKKNIEEFNNVIKNIQSDIDFINYSTELNENVYASKSDLPNVDEYISKVNKIRASYIDLSTRLDLLSEPASKIGAEIDEELKNLYALKEEVSAIKDNFDKDAGDVQRARTSLIKFQLVVNQAEISVRASRLPSISDSFSKDLKECKTRIKNIQQLLDSSSVDLSVLNEKIKDTMDFIYSFSNNVKNLVGLSIMTENAIVFGNKFRSSHQEIDSDLSKSEFSFINGEYTKAVQLAIKTMDRLYPDSKKASGVVNN